MSALDAAISYAASLHISLSPKDVEAARAELAALRERLRHAEAKADAQEQLAGEMRAEVERLRQAQREYEHEVQAGRSEQHDRLVAEVERLRAVQPTVCTVDIDRCAVILGEWIDRLDTAEAEALVRKTLHGRARPVSVEAVAIAIQREWKTGAIAQAEAAIRAVGAAIQNTPKPAGGRTAPEEAPLVQHAKEATVSNAAPPASPQAGALEQLAAEIHSVYMREAERQHDLRHAYDYADLPENIKEYDRVLARWIIERYSKPVRVKLPPVPEKERNFTGIETGLYEEALRDVRRALCEQGVEVEP